MVRLRGRVLTATLFAAVLALTGCQSRVGTNFGAPGLPPTTVAPQTQAPAPAAPVAVPTAQATTVAGLARLAGAPMANANLTVENALTGTPMTLLLSDGREVVGMDASLTTDAAGRFSVRVLNLSADQVLRVVVTSGDKKLSALVSGDGINLSGYTLLDTTFLVNVDEVSRAIDLVATGPLTLIANTLKPSAGAAVRTALLNDLKATTAKLVEAARTNGTLAAILNSFSTLKTPADQAKAVKDALAEASLSTEVNALVKSTMQATALQARQAANLAESYSPAAFEGVQLVGTTFTVQLGSGNSLQIVNTSNKEIINVTGGTGGAGGGGSGGGGSSGGGTGTTYSFNPTVTATYETGTLSVAVSQPANDDEIGSMVAEISASDADLLLVGTEPQLDSETDESTVVFGGVIRQLDILQEDTVASSVTLPSAFGGGTHTAVWRGILKVEGSQRLGTFQVLEANAKIYLVATYDALPAGFEVTAARTATLKAVNALDTFGPTTSARVLLEPRNASQPPVKSLSITLPD